VVLDARSIRSWAAVAALVSCAETIQVDVAGVPLDYGSVVTFSDTGEPVAASAVFGVEDGRVVFGELPQIRLGPDEASFALIALARDGIHPAFVPSRATELDVLLEPSPDALVVEGTDLTRLDGRIRVPDQATISTARFDDPVLRPGEVDLERITLRIPVDPEYCLDPMQTELAPYGADVRPRGPLQDIVAALEIDGDRAVVASKTEIYVLPRHGTTSTVWRLPDDPDYVPGEQLNDVAIGAPRTDGSREILAVGGFLERDAELPTFGKIWRLRLDGDRVTRDGPLFRVGAGLWFRVVAYGPDGCAFAGQEDGHLLVRADERSPWIDEVALMTRTDVPRFVGQLVATGDPEFPLMASTKNYVHRMNASRVWESEILMRGGILGPESNNYEGLGLVRDGGVPDFWAGGQRGQIGRKAGAEPFELFENRGIAIGYPPRFSACASSANPGEPLTYNREINDLVVAGDHVFMAYENCRALVVLRRADLCVWMLPIAGQATAFVEDSFVVMSRSGRRILVASEDGELYETLLPGDP
jgi:hypothetical protein